jgi:hypothetical protein
LHTENLFYTPSIALFGWLCQSYFGGYYARFWWVYSINKLTKRCHLLTFGAHGVRNVSANKSPGYKRMTLALFRTLFHCLNENWTKGSSSVFIAQ